MIGWLIAIVIGVLAGWIAEKLMKRDHGLLTNLVVGLVGALIGRFLGAEVAHVEAGMRTGDIWHPMPEEINRRLVAKIATLHFAPTQLEVEHLRREKAKGSIVDTGANTVIDALRLAIDGETPAIELPEHFGLVTLHRCEMLRHGPVFSRTLEVLAAASDCVILAWVERVANDARSSAA